MVPVVEKSKMSLILKRQKMPSENPEMSSRLLIKSVLFGNHKDKDKYTNKKLDNNAK